ncbi:hypothetical protein GGR53DRAFT_177356 [Hypoxylon sp. FL1150]|nr:hypothetical protein GGR53DRAFT_177356 [Hypoxylon sp. FL1150]
MHQSFGPFLLSFIFVCHICCYQIIRTGCSFWRGIRTNRCGGSRRHSSISIETSLRGTMILLVTKVYASHDQGL